jgi:hypothetical protein
VRDDLRDLAMFCHTYPGRDPDDETLNTYYGLIDLIPDYIKKLFIPENDDLMEQARELELSMRVEDLSKKE